ncbi:MAG: hypothetical protein ACKO5P_06170 [Nodosilinea sp.]
MNRSSTNRLYQLLPAIYRERDFDRRELESLLAIVEHKLEILETDIALDSAKFFVLRGRWHKKEHPSDKRAQNVRDWLKYQTISQVHYGII